MALPGWQISDDKNNKRLSSDLGGAFSQGICVTHMNRENSSALSNKVDYTSKHLRYAVPGLVTQLTMDVPGSFYPSGTGAQAAISITSILENSILHGNEACIFLETNPHEA